MSDDTERMELRMSTDRLHALAEKVIAAIFFATLIGVLGWPL
jgi:hypothetical protein